MSAASDQIFRWKMHPDRMVRDLFGVEPDPWQQETLEVFPHSPRIAMKASKGPGKAQPKDTLILTPRGVVLFDQLKPGSEIFAGDGSITRVKAVYDRGVLPVFKIVFDDGCETRACGEHLWKVRGAAERARKHSIPYRRSTQTREVWSILSTDQIIKRGVRHKNGRWAGRQFEIPRQGAVQLPRQEHQPIDPYVLGVWLGDGVRLTGRYATKPTPEIEAEIKRRGYETSGETDGIVCVYGIAEQLRGLGIWHHYSHEREVPRCYLMGSIDQRTDLICGLMDTDGGIDADGHMEFSSTSERLAEDVVSLVRSLGGLAFIKAAIKKPFYYGKNREKILGRDCYRVTVRLPFNPFRVPHRKSRWTDPMRSPSTARYMTRRIDRIEPDGEADCMCIEVDHPDQLYLTNDFIVTHNTCVLAWLIWNFLLTRPHPKIAATSIDRDNLRDNLWTELAYWQQKSPLLSKTFTWTKERIFANDFPETWWCSARSYAKSADKSQQANTLAGLHAPYIMFVLDESGGMTDAIMAAADAALSSCTEGHIVQAGNPTHLAGPLYDACTRHKSLWKVIEINGDPDNPKRASRVNIEWARQQIALHGRDNPWVLINVFGQFPPSSLNTLIGPDEVRAAMFRYYREYEIGKAPKVLGVDVARFGDDTSVIAPRWGIQMLPLIKRRNIDSTQGAGMVARHWDDWGADGTFIDATGGFGSGWIDALSQLGKAPVGVQFAGKAHDSGRFFNKRCEMAFDFVDWIKAGGALPDDDNLLAALVNTTYTFKGDKFLLEPKDDVKLKIGSSPDEFDACMLTFAEPVTAATQKRRENRSAMPSQYNEFAEMDALAAVEEIHRGRGR